MMNDAWEQLLRQSQEVHDGFLADNAKLDSALSAGSVGDWIAEKANEGNDDESGDDQSVVAG